MAWSRSTSPAVFTSVVPSYSGPEHGHEVTVAAPYQAYVSVYVSSDSGDPPKYWTRAEIDYGDGVGWVDVTGTALYFWKHHGAMTASAYVLKTFAPGDYHVRSRATYYDGEMLESESSEEVYLHVTN